MRDIASIGGEVERARIRIEGGDRRVLQCTPSTFLPFNLLLSFTKLGTRRCPHWVDWAYRCSITGTVDSLEDRAERGGTRESEGFINLRSS
jgi:hypothetical protein